MLGWLWLVSGASEVSQIRRLIGEVRSDFKRLLNLDVCLHSCSAGKSHSERMENAIGAVILAGHVFQPKNPKGRGWHFRDRDFDASGNKYDLKLVLYQLMAFRLSFCHQRLVTQFQLH